MYQIRQWRKNVFFNFFKWKIIFLTFVSTFKSPRAVVLKAPFVFLAIVVKAAFTDATRVFGCAVVDVMKSTFDVEHSTVVGHGRVKPFVHLGYVDLKQI